MSLYLCPRWRNKIDLFIYLFQSGVRSDTGQCLLGPLLFLLFTSSCNSVRVTVGETLIRDLGRVSKWYDLQGMKLCVSKTKTMVDDQTLV